MKDCEGQWHVFNDFAVNPIQPEEAISFFPDWKLPCLLVYSVCKIASPPSPSRNAPLISFFISQRVDHHQELARLPVMSPITSDVFKEDKSLAQKSEGLQRISFLPLVCPRSLNRDKFVTPTFPLLKAADEMPGKSDLVAMDAEFVTLNQEEAELRSDGKTTTVRPSQMSVARVTVIRG